MDAAALKESWAIVAKSGDEVPLYFYSHLFLSHPELRELFPISMAAQRDKLVTALGTIVSNVDKVEEVKPFIEVTWAHAAAEGEGHASLEEWRAGHRRFWSGIGTPVDDHTPVVCIAFRLVQRL